jgi:hypothetical protein
MTTTVPPGPAEHASSGVKPLSSALRPARSPTPRTGPASTGGLAGCLFRTLDRSPGEPLKRSVFKRLHVAIYLITEPLLFGPPLAFHFSHLTIYLITVPLLLGPVLSFATRHFPIDLVLELLGQCVDPRVGTGGSAIIARATRAR